MDKVYLLISDDACELPILFCETMTELADKCDLSISTVSRAIKDSQVNGTWCRFVEVPLSGKFILPTRKKVLKQRGKTGKMVKCGDTVYDSALKAAKELGVNVSTIRRWIKERPEWDYTPTTK